MKIRDQFGRVYKKLRVSVTDRCSFRCFYCQPAERILPRSEILTFDEIAKVTELLANLGIEEIRLTGGEPLARHRLEELIPMLWKIPGIKKVALTTNGASLLEKAPILKKAGLSDVNVSLDTLIPEKFEKICGVKAFYLVQEGIRAAKKESLFPKINVVVVRGVNEEEIAPFLLWSQQEKVPVRFIEWMPTYGTSWSREQVVTEKEILERAEILGKIEQEERGAGPAQMYRIRKAGIVFGVIPTVSSPFCALCNRLRLTAQGTLYPCLFSQVGLDLKSLLRSNRDSEEISFKIHQTLFFKEQGFVANPMRRTSIPMVAMGG